MQAAAAAPVRGLCVLRAPAASALCHLDAAARQIAAKWGPDLPCLSSYSAQQSWHSMAEQAQLTSSTFQPLSRPHNSPPPMVGKSPAPRHNPALHPPPNHPEQVVKTRKSPVAEHVREPLFGQEASVVHEAPATPPAPVLRGTPGLHAATGAQSMVKLRAGSAQQLVLNIVHARKIEL